MNEPNQVWVADITYIWTKEGWLYLASIMDLFSRKIVGWHLSERMTKELVSKAFQRAIHRRNPQPGLIHHSDQGSQYASNEYQAMLRQYCKLARYFGTKWPFFCKFKRVFAR
ncbi:transposase InsO family protein [Anoxybacillus voinovskiensis]|uniref:Transposase InsO family protein n=1 Tax=Anoxybacteroides voinovskiense TaxID=230470 RepID=A0A840DQE2_9BACL|nr:DDE-type integrase/transposase/recombinase [Anoxybacillus voinovskiensis]MBB4073825.1 transposase InsO family protein [Anoxybacillus voinovskiensis]